MSENDGAVADAKQTDRTVAADADGHALDDSLGFLVNVIARYMRAALEERLKEYEITSTQWVVLQGIAESDMMKQTELGRRVELDNATITRQVDRLEQAGLIRRNQTDEDRRTQLISLTAKGRGLLPKLNEQANEVNRIARRRIRTSRMNRLLADLRLIHDNLRDNSSH
ncbi:MAG: Organic hydroperoxide resistance transcriptional regulator [Calditrichaeota bacterium]|nr:Organic hydroperoxide resistance transcriptional regulator [Calditrichota bacterium]